jgi:hypothetical protein
MTAAHSISDEYRAPLKMAAVLSASFALLSMLVLDFGETARLTAGGLIVFWACVFIGVWRRPLNPTRFDLWLIWWGCLLLIVGFQCLVHFVWHLRGLE